ncbi:MAG: hypothetical protein NTV86_00210 [Planctomycetota bacterium]|nr:hypothetical protein [Planctomycetota bacterium]
MADFRNREDWERTANVMALIANCNRDPKKRPSPYGPGEFGRYARATSTGGITVTKETIGLMRAEFENSVSQNRKG